MVKEASRYQEQFWSMVEDLSGWRCLELEAELSGEAVETGLAVENLPLSSQ